MGTLVLQKASNAFKSKGKNISFNHVLGMDWWGQFDKKYVFIKYNFLFVFLFSWYNETMTTKSITVQ